MNPMAKKVTEYAVKYNLVGSEVRMKIRDTLTLDNDKTIPVILLGFLFEHGSLAVVVREPAEECMVHAIHYSKIVELDPTWKESP